MLMTKKWKRRIELARRLAAQGQGVHAAAFPTQLPAPAAAGKTVAFAWDWRA